ncbi:hypothetical protein M0804_006856 [Polistes exclamans]|nr:hypothetical protein M0804_006856 [Polistes exclamans]
METFLNINWETDLTDIVDNEFINGERLIKESVMHRMLHGDFKNPFNYMDEDYAAVKVDMIEISDDSSEESEYNVCVTKLNELQKKLYIPGYERFPSQFPMSALTAEEQNICLRMIMKFSINQQSVLTLKDKQNLCTYRRIKHIIRQEQDQYSKIVEKIWEKNKWKKIYCEDFFNARWKYRSDYILTLPKYYLEETYIPFILDEEINVEFLSTCLSKGELPEIKLPTLTKRFTLDCNSERLQEYFPILNKSCNPPVHFKLSVSKDPTCKSLAQDNEVDLVISSSGLNCLASNAGLTDLKAWMLPVTIKYFNGKNIIYINKPAPPVSANIPEKNHFVFKYILRKAIFQHEPVSERSDGITIYDDDDMFGNLYSDDYISLEKDNSSSISSSNNAKLMEDFENKSMNKEDVSKLKKSDYLNTSKLKEEMHNIEKQYHKKEKGDTKPYSSSCVSYNLFKIGPSSKEKNFLMKSTLKEYKILVRTKEDGYENSQESTRQKILLVPKLEHQTAFGGEAITLNEGLKQWISLIFRPDTCIARVRISMSKAEIIQIQKRNALAICNEVKRLYNKKVNVSLILLYNIIQTLSYASPGNYIITNSKDGTFAIVYKETSTTGQNVLDLQTLYESSQCHTIPTFSWPKLDRLCITPLHERLNRMPLMFIPRKGHKRKLKAKTSTSEEINK